MLTRQWTTYSCGAACFQWVLRHSGRPCPSHRIAIDEVRCKPNGTTFSRMVNAFKRYGVTVKKLHTMSVATIIAHLDHGDVVLINDNQTYKHDHFEVIAGVSGNNFLVYDPVWGLRVKRSQSSVLAAAEAMYALA